MFLLVNRAATRIKRRSTGAIHQAKLDSTDLKYFWRRYFGAGVEGLVLDSDNVSGAVLGTLTVRYPIGCSRFAPYAWAGGGAIFGGGERDRVVLSGATLTTDHSEGESKAMGQFGGGIEVRITRHIGWTNDFSWNVVDGPHNNFGMVRSGLTFAF